ncbi:hypothetical protein DUI87_30876 [Hirundo rustica rustica]|uniref:Ig-like domain-containing protein n=2 Tax=Hirundo rustica TaxID=43150 RepID=A0A3M0IXP5_HIRRU|nr:hypothetical protein DUI87_30876 [Hirundo rustica rustica]
MAAALGLGLLLGVLGLLGEPGGANKVLHSLRYLDVAVSEPSPGIPQFLAMAFVDGILFGRYDSERGRVEPLAQGIKDEAEPGFWDNVTQVVVQRQCLGAVNLEMLRVLYNQSRGLHTVLTVYGCDLLSNGSVRGSFRCGYDGRDFISFDLGSRRFVAADATAEITRRCWEDQENEDWVWTNHLEHECPEWLRKCVRYGQKDLERKEPPDVHVSGKEEHGMLILSCHAYGFYPNTIAVSWMKGDEIWDQETEWSRILPNSDGTFHTWARIEALPEERDLYRCRVEHPGMQEPGIFAWGKRDRSGYNMAAGEFQWWIQLWIPSVWIPGWILVLILVCDPCWNLMDLLFLQEEVWEPMAQPHVKNEGAQEQVLEEMVLTNANEWCKAAILSLSIEPAPTLHDMLQGRARKIPFIKAHQSHSSRVKPPQKAAAANTVPPVPVPWPPPKRGTTCLLCDQAGHWVSQCPLKKQFLDFRDNGGGRSQRSKGNFSKKLENVNVKLNNPALTSSAFQQKSPAMIVKDPATRETRSPHGQITWGRGYTDVSTPPGPKWVPAEWVKPFIPKTAKPPAEGPQVASAAWRRRRRRTFSF